MVIYQYQHESPLGILSLASDGPHLCGLWIENQKHFEAKLEQRVLGTNLKQQEPLVRLTGQDALNASRGLQAAVAWLNSYFAGENPKSLPPLALHGTEFQEQVWAQIAQIPYGQVRTYKDLAEAIRPHRPSGAISYRAVGTAVGKNPISVIVPCHRVIGTTGKLTGYAGGLKRKLQLLELEGVNTAPFSA